MLPSPSGVALQLVEEGGEHFHVIGVDLGLHFHALRIVLVMRHGMVAVGHADLRIGAGAELARQHEADNAGDVALEGDGPQVEQQRGVIGEGIGDAHGGFGRAVAGGFAVLLFGLGDAAFDFAHVLEVIVDAGFVFRVHALGQIFHAGGDAVENAEVVAQAGDALFRRGAVAAEHAFEEHARVQLHGIRRGGGAPGNGVHVGAGVVAAAAAELRGVVLGGDFERRDRWCPGRSFRRSSDRWWCRRGFRCRARAWCRSATWRC